MILLKDENVKILNEFDQSNRSAVMNLLMYRYSIPEFDADDIMQDAWVLLLEKLAGHHPQVANHEEAAQRNSATGESLRQWALPCCPF